jgi:hypothetical protein
MCRVWLVLVLAVLTAVPGLAQYAETARTLAAVDGFGSVGGVAQIGRRLFIAGGFAHVSAPTGGAVVVDAAGAHIPAGFPRFEGAVRAIVPDGLGGWVVAGGFTRVNGQPHAGLARVRPDRTVDPRYRVTTDGTIQKVAIAHGRIYLVGNFTAINGARRRGLAALDATSGTLSSFAAGFDPGGRNLSAFSVSSIGVYVSGCCGATTGGRFWGLDAGTGQVLFVRDVWVNALAATSARVYVGGFGYQRPIWAVDPLTGQDAAWTLGLTFQLVSGSYGDYTTINALLLDSGRLYFAGRFAAAGGRMGVAAVDAASGQPLAWRPEHPPFIGLGLTRLGPAVVATSDSAPRAFDVATGALQAWNPRPYGTVDAVAPAPDGAVIGGSFNGIDGVARQHLASIDLDTAQLEPWAPALPSDVQIQQLDTDGTVLIAKGRQGRFHKIDPVSGAVLATIDFGDDAGVIRFKIADGRLLVAASHASGPTEIAVVNIADFSRQVVPVMLGGPFSNYVTGLEVDGTTAYLAGSFTTVNTIARPFLAAVNLDTGALLPFAPSPESAVYSVVRWGSRLLASGSFRRIGGARRRGLAELDPVTGRALAWNPDSPGGAQMEAGPDGLLYVWPTTSLLGQAAPRTLMALSPQTRRPVPWRPWPGNFPLFEYVRLLPDCLVVTGLRDVTCYPVALPSPANLTAQQQGSRITLTWTLPAGPVTWTGIRVEASSREGDTPFTAIDLPANATSIAEVVPAGSYFVRVRTTRADADGIPTPDVSFAVGPPTVPAAPLEATAVTEGTQLTFAWKAPSTGAPPLYVIEAGSSAGLSDVARLFVSGTLTGLSLDAPPGRYWGRMRAVNGEGGSVPSGELVIDVDATDSWCWELPPQAPQHLAASVTGGRVSLTWVQPDEGPVPNTQRIVAGSAPGRDDLGAFGVPGPATSFATTAPPGTYYVRVVAFNTCGASPFSNEVTVVVP